MEEEKKNNKGLYVIIVVLCLLVLGLGGYVVYDKILDNKEVDTKENNKEKSNNDNTKKTDNTNDTSVLTGKIDINDYCPKTGDCKKEIGDIKINGNTLKLSVDLNNINTENVSGFIKLDSKEIDISKLSYYSMEKRFDGFEVYGDYLIAYTSNLETMETANKECQIRGYMMYFLDSNLSEVSGLAGYTKDNPLNDFKIENDYLYYYALTSNIPASVTDVTHTNVLVYEKIAVNKIISKDYEGADFISSISECQVGES